MIPQGTPARRSIGFDALYRELRDRISLLTYPPGMMLSENRLAAEFGVSRTPIRRVLQRLEYDGLVVSKHGIGTQVTSLDLRYIRQVYALRINLLDLSAGLPRAKFSAEDFAGLEALLEQVGAVEPDRDYTELARIYLRFNDALAGAVDNQPLREIVERLFYQTSRVWVQVLPDLDWEAEVESVRDEIESAADTLRRGAMRELAQARREHLVARIRRVNDSLSGFDLTVQPAARLGMPSGPRPTHQAPGPPDEEPQGPPPASRGGDQ